MAGIVCVYVSVPEAWKVGVLTLAECWTQREDDTEARDVIRCYSIINFILLILRRKEESDLKMQSHPQSTLNPSRNNKHGEAERRL